MSEESVILVEGKNDRKVLEKIGLENILEISGKRLEQIVSILEEKGGKVTILTDYDSEGIRQYKRLKSLLNTTDVEVDDNTRRKFKTKFLINKIEEMQVYLK